MTWARRSHPGAACRLCRRRGGRRERQTEAARDRGVALARRESLDHGGGDDDRADQHVHARPLHRLWNVDGLMVDTREERAAGEDLLQAGRHDPGEEHTRLAAAAEPVRAPEERRQVRVEGSGARRHEEAVSGPRRRRRLQPAAGRAAGDAGTRRRHRQALRDDRQAEAAAGRRKGAGREAEVACDSSCGPLHRRVLHPRSRRAADRVGPADLQHDPVVDLLATARDRGDEARRGDELVRARPVHARGRLLRARRGAACRSSSS